MLPVLNTELLLKFPLQGFKWFQKLGTFYQDDLQKLVDDCVSLVGVGLTTMMLLIRAQECNLSYLFEWRRMGTTMCATLLDSHYTRVNLPESKIKAPGSSPSKPQT